jgi:hypothetical protein
VLRDLPCSTLGDIVSSLPSQAKCRLHIALLLPIATVGGRTMSADSASSLYAIPTVWPQVPPPHWQEWKGGIRVLEVLCNGKPYVGTVPANPRRIVRSRIGSYLQAKGNPTPKLNLTEEESPHAANVHLR